MRAKINKLEGAVIPYDITALTIHGEFMFKSRTKAWYKRTILGRWSKIPTMAVPDEVRLNMEYHLKNCCNENSAFNED